MNKLVIILFYLMICCANVDAGKKVFTFMGNMIHFDDEYHSITANNGTKEMCFFVAGDIIRGEDLIDIGNLREGCTIAITYQKTRNRLIASKVVIQESIAVNQYQENKEMICKVSGMHDRQVN